MRCIKLYFILMFLAPAGAAAAVEHICGKFYIDKRFLQIFETLNPNEKKVVCGEAGTSWVEVPEKQSIYHIKTFLQKQGYYSPKFNREDQRVVITLGEKTTVKKLSFNRQPDGFQKRSKVQILGEPLTSDTLNQLEKWTLSHLRSIGYPCPVVNLSAGIEDGEVLVDLNPGPKKKFSELEFRQDVPGGLNRRSLNRYQAYVDDQYFNSDLTLLTSRRLMLSGVLRHSHYVINCEKERPVLWQRNTIGKPRLISIGIGASTEEGAVTELRWRHARIDESASSVTAQLKLSFRTQEIALEPRFFLFDSIPYLYFSPTASISRKVEDEYRSRTGQLGAGLGYQRDDDERHYSASFSPTYNYTETEEGIGPDSTQYLSFNTLLAVVSHYYEYYARNPRAGYHFNFQWKARKSQVGAEFSSDLFKSNGTLLHNYSNFDPPSVVLGLRWAVGTNAVNEINEDQVPFEDRFFLGGDDDIRGFSRHSINNGERGFFSSVYVGTEVRMLKILPFELQPFVFADVAKVGEHSWMLNPEFYWAPGFGVRWQSPVGAFRVSLGRGFISAKQTAESYPAEEWVLFGSYGKVF